MKLAIHYRKNTFSDSADSFNNRWINYCKKKNIPFKLVDAYKDDIIQQIDDCDAFLWHFYHYSFKDFLFAKQLLFAIEASGKKVFPSSNMAWHFDDKVGQKYLLEAIKAPLVESHVFYYKEEALKWMNNQNFPIVFKLRGGGGAQNVKLLKTKSEGETHVKKAFKKGFSQYSSKTIFRDRILKYKEGNDTLWGVTKGFIRLILPTKFAKDKGNEKGYIYFQKFLPNNDSDTRIIIIGGRAFAAKRMVRENDFRASGSGIKEYAKELFDERTIKISFEISKRLNLECVAFDFIFDEKNNPLIVEISYGFAIEFYDPCPGYWDDSLNWHQGKFIPQEWIIDDLIEKVKK